MKRIACVAVLGLGLLVAAHAEAAKPTEAPRAVDQIRPWQPPHGSSKQQPPRAPKMVNKIRAWHPPHPQR
jgi:hypothetical protein